MGNCCQAKSSSSKYKIKEHNIQSKQIQDHTNHADQQKKAVLQIEQQQVGKNKILEEAKLNPIESEAKNDQLKPQVKDKNVEDIFLQVLSSTRNVSQNQASQYQCLVHFDNDCLTKCLINKEPIYKCGTNNHGKQYICTISPELLNPVRCPICRSVSIIEISNNEKTTLEKILQKCYICHQNIQKEDLCQHLIERVNPTCKIYPTNDYGIFLMLCPLVQCINLEKIELLLEQQDNKSIEKELIDLFNQHRLIGQNTEVSISQNILANFKKRENQCGFSIVVKNKQIMFQCESIENYKIHEDKIEQIEQQHQLLTIILDALIQQHIQENQNQSQILENQDLSSQEHPELRSHQLQNNSNQSNGQERNQPSRPNEQSGSASISQSEEQKSQIVQGNSGQDHSQELSFPISLILRQNIIQQPRTQLQLQVFRPQFILDRQQQQQNNQRIESIQDNIENSDKQDQASQFSNLTGVVEHQQQRNQEQSVQMEDIISQVSCDDA